MTPAKRPANPQNADAGHLAIASLPVTIRKSVRGESPKDGHV